MNRSFLFAAALFSAIVGIALISDGNVAQAGHRGCYGCNGCYGCDGTVGCSGGTCGGYYACHGRRRRGCYGCNGCSGYNDCCGCQGANGTQAPAAPPAPLPDGSANAPKVNKAASRTNASSPATRG